MKQETKKIEKIITQINKNIKNKKWKCIIDDCDSESINAHILQKNGILNQIDKDGFIYEIKPKDVFKWNGLRFDEITAFKKIGLKEAHSYPTLCNKHDTEIFLPIETHPIDFSSYKINLLFAFRTLLSMRRKEEIVLEKEKRIINSNIIQAIPDSKNLLINSESNVKFLIELLTIRKSEINLMLDNIINSSVNYSYEHFTYPLKETYSSSIHFSPEKLESVYVNIFPYNNTTRVLLLFPNETSDSWTNDYVDSWKHLSDEDFELKLTSHLLLKCENWGVSEEIYLNLSKQDHNEIIKITQKAILNDYDIFDYDLRVGYNLF